MPRFAHENQRGRNSTRLEGIQILQWSRLPKRRSTGERGGGGGGGRETDRDRDTGRKRVRDIVRDRDRGTRRERDRKRERLPSNTVS